MAEAAEAEGVEIVGRQGAAAGADDYWVLISDVQASGAEESIRFYFGGCDCRASRRSSSRRSRPASRARRWCSVTGLSRTRSSRAPEIRPRVSTSASHPTWADNLA